MGDDTVEFSQSERDELRTLLDGVLFASRAEVLEAAARIVVQDAELLRRLGDG